MEQRISAEVKLKIQTLRTEEENLKLEVGELLKTGEISFEVLLERIRDTEKTVSKDSFDAISDNRKKVGQ